MKSQVHGLPPKIKTPLLSPLLCPAESDRPLHFYITTLLSLHGVHHDTLNTNNLKLESVTADKTWPLTVEISCSTVLTVATPYGGNPARWQIVAI